MINGLTAFVIAVAMVCGAFLINKLSDATWATTENGMVSRLKQWLVRLVLPLCLATVLSACSAGAAPCRVTADVVKIVPVVGDIIGTAFEACGNIID